MQSNISLIGSARRVVVTRCGNWWSHLFTSKSDYLLVIVLLTIPSPLAPSPPTHVIICPVFL